MTNMYFTLLSADQSKHEYLSETKYETRDFVNANIVWAGDMKYF